MNAQPLRPRTKRRRHLSRPGFFSDPTPFLGVPIGLWHRILLIFIVFVLLACVGAALLCRPALGRVRRRIYFSDENVSVRVDTAAQTVGEFLNEMNVLLAPSDTLNANASDLLVDGQHLHLRRGIVLYIADNTDPTPELIALHAPAGSTLGSLMRSGSEALAGNLSLPADTVLKPGMVIGVDNIHREIVTETQAVPYHTITKWSASMDLGESRVETPGQEGRRQSVTQILTVNGQEVSRTVLSEIVLEQAVDEVIVQGSRTQTPKPTATPKATAKASTAKPTAAKTPAKTQTAALSGDQTTVTVGGKTYNVKSTLSVTVTAYTHTGNSTSSGAWPSYGTVAVDTSIIPMGTKLYIPGYGIGTAQDTGVSGNHIDIFYETYNECITWGRKTKTIYILE